MPHVQLHSIGDGCAEGLLQGHPCAAMVVRTYRHNGDLYLSLWEGPHRVGEGRLFAGGNTWGGCCEERGARWMVSGRINSGQLEFRG